MTKTDLNMSTALPDNELVRDIEPDEPPATAEAIAAEAEAARVELRADITAAHPTIRRFLLDLDVDGMGEVSATEAERRQMFRFAALGALVEEIQDWQRATFPGTSILGRAKHLQKEAGEVVAAVEALTAQATRQPYDDGATMAAIADVGEELADAFMLLVAVASKAGVNLHEVAAAKLAKNRLRKWGKPDADDVIEHVAEGDRIVVGFVPTEEARAELLTDNFSGTRVAPGAAGAFMPNVVKVDGGVEIEVDTEGEARALGAEMERQGLVVNKVELNKAIALQRHPLPWAVASHPDDYVRDANGDTIFDTRGSEDVAAFIVDAVNAGGSIEAVTVTVNLAATPAKQRQANADAAIVANAARAQTAAAEQVEAVSPSLVKLENLLAALDADGDVGTDDSTEEHLNQLRKVLQAHEVAGEEGERGRHLARYSDTALRLSCGLSNLEGVNLADVCVALMNESAALALGHDAAVKLTGSPTAESIVIACLRSAMERGGDLGVSLAGFTADGENKVSRGFIAAAGPGQASELQKAWALIDIDDKIVDGFAVGASEIEHPGVDIDGLRRQALLPLLDESSPTRLGFVVGLLNARAGELVSPFADAAATAGLDPVSSAVVHGVAAGVERRKTLDDIVAAGQKGGG